jgi:sugar lactone lactonase YvrE
LIPASTRFAAVSGVIGSDTVNAGFLDVIEQSATGRILECDPATKTTRIVARGLSFANDVALSREENAVRHRDRQVPRVEYRRHSHEAGYRPGFAPGNRAA